MTRLRHLGPGLLLAATSIGASHLLMSPEAGARFELGLVWLVVAVHILKYPAFEAAPRYVAARGESLLDAYAAAPGPKHWALWLGLVDMTIQAVGLIAALVGLTASFLRAAVGGPSIPVWSVGLTVLLLALLAVGHYKALRLINIVLLLGVAAGTAVAALAAPPPLVPFAKSLVLPSFPDGSLVLVAAILGFMPTSVAVSLWHSLWALEQRERTPAAGDAAPGSRAALERLRRGLVDLRLGYGLSAALAVAFVTLGATVLFPRGLVPEGTDVALTLSQLYTVVLGKWMQPLVLAMAFAALFTTCYTMMDGLPRSFVAATRALRSQPTTVGGADRHYWIFLVSVTVAGMAILAVVPDPAFLVKVIGALGLLFSPIYYTLNMWAVTRRIDDPRLRPGLALQTLALIGIVSMAATAGLILWTTLGGVA
ncbi:MAG: Nramp family divalent metal transporter [Acidobacteriota bacterium]